MFKNRFILFFLSVALIGNCYSMQKQANVADNIAQHIGNMRELQPIKKMEILNQINFMNEQKHKREQTLQNQIPALYEQINKMNNIQWTETNEGATRAIVDHTKNVLDVLRKRIDDLQNQIDALLNTEIPQMDDANPYKAAQVERVNNLKQQIADMDTEIKNLLLLQGDNIIKVHQ